MSGVDTLARNLARSAADGATRLRTVDRLRRGIARVGGRLPGITAPPPTIGAAAAASTLTGATTFQPASGGVLVTPERFTLVGAAWSPGVSYPGGEVVKGVACYQGNGTDAGITTGAVNGGRVRFVSFAPALELVFVGGSNFRLKVDGEYIQTGQLGTAAGNGAFPTYLPLTWGDGSAAQRKLRHYELEFRTMNGFGGVRCSALYSPETWPVEDRLRMIVHGDSMVGTFSDVAQHQVAPHGVTADVIAALTGQPDCWESGVGGTGFAANLNGTRSTFLQRVDTDVIARAPDIIWEMGGLNDSAATAAQLQALVETWLGRVTAALPNVVILMTGQAMPKAAVAGSAVIRDAKAAAAAKFARNVVFLDNVAGGWTTGTGRQDAAAGNGNADWITGPDGTHPTIEGHVHNAQRFVAAAGLALEALR